jgi:glucosamine--fructose-6-phosphate aminotransferase (isomerizing)
VTQQEITTHMSAEVASIPALTQNLLDQGDAQAAEIGAKLRTLNPHVVTTIARGSSDHACSYLKYAIELLLGVPVASAGPSISSVYGASMHLHNAVSIAISQSGESPDILSTVQTAKDGGSLVLSFANNSTSPLAKLSDKNINIGAGVERSVAATKTFVLSIVAGLMVVAHWKQDIALIEGLSALPSEFDKALDCDWSKLANHIASEDQNVKSLYVLGRGPSFAIAEECALKFKETCQLHAEAYSSAEVLHGPVSIAQEGFTVLALASNDASRSSVIESSQRMAKQGVDVFVTSSDAQKEHTLPVVHAQHPITDPLVQVVTFYNFIEQLSRKLGLNPDEPPHLRKVTETV